MFVRCDCCVLSGRGLCDKLISHPHESYWLWCVVVCDLETSWMRRPWPTGGCRAKNRQTYQTTTLEFALMLCWCCHFVLRVCGRSVYSKHLEINDFCVQAQVQVPAGKPLYVLSKNVFLISNLNKPQQR